MNRSKLHLLWNMAALLLCASAASCSQDEIDIEQGEPLPPDKYPLELMTSSIDETQSRAAGKDEWTYDGTEYIGVRIGADGNIGKYVIGAGGSAQPASIDQTIYWQSTAPATVTAWYPFETQTAKDITDQSGGYEAIDYLKATAENKRFTDKVDLSFIHQMAKVSCTLKKGDGITDEDLKGAVVQIAGYTKASFSEGILTGMVDGWITPASNNDVLLVPQDMTNSQFIKVNINNNDFIYTPGEGAANLQSGTHYSYTITVKKDGIEVNCPQGVEWTDNETSDTQSPVFHIKTIDGIELEAGDGCILSEGDGFKQLSGGNVLKVKIPMGLKIPFPQGRYTIDTYEYKDDFSYICQLKLRSDITFTSISETQQLQVGDFYYADGTCLDKLLMNLPCIGIVFRVGAGDADGISAYGDKLTAIQGYAVALHDVARFGIKWSENTENCGTSTSTTDYKGYENTQKIQQVSNYSETEYPICWKVAHFGDTDTQAPSGSSGWYLPSAAQMTDVVNLWKDTNGIIRQRLQELSTYPIYQHQWLLPTTEHGYATSTEHVDSPTSHVYRIGSNGGMQKEQKNYSAGNFAVRAVLTF